MYQWIRADISVQIECIPVYWHTQVAMNDSQFTPLSIRFFEAEDNYGLEQ